MTILKKARKNLFLVIVALVYLGLFIVSPSTGAKSIKESSYYLKEMLFIMPVIFILTALLDMWVPKEKIIDFLGEGAGGKGILFSFVIGSISAGPIYAAFPMCVMFRKKGASIRNIVIILSSWAVIKIPMLLNEAKFLGLKFMIVRWILTVLAIIVFSWLTAKLVKEKDLPEEVDRRTGLNIDQNACMGCTLCAANYSTLFEMEGNKAIIKEHDKNVVDLNKLQDTIEACPVRAISYPEV